MNASLRRRVPVSLVLILLMGLTPLQSARAQDTSRYFPETGKTIAGRFLQYWDEHDGLAQQGFPISPELQEKSDTDGQIYTVQYFERAVFELHPENQPPYDVLLSLLGVRASSDKYPGGVPGQAANNSERSVLFPETGKLLGGRFLEYWQQNGGLAQQGYPISDEFSEKSDLDGKFYKVQYFERAVFELHPENQPPYDVLLSQLGWFRYRAMYVAKVPPDIAVPVPPTMSPQAAAYLREALDFVQMYYLGREKFDWVYLRRQAFDMARDAQTTVATYPAIDMVVAALHDPHSGFRRPEEIAEIDSAPSRQLGIIVWYQDGKVTKVDPGSMGEKAGVQVGDMVTLINGAPRDGMESSQFFSQLYGGTSVRLTLEREGQSEPVQVDIEHDFVRADLIPSGRRLAGDIGYINVPSTVGFRVGSGPQHTAFGSVGQQIIRDIDSTGDRPIRGWVVDLQTNIGGSVSPMVLAVGPVIGDGHLGSFLYMDGRVSRWELESGKYRLVDYDVQQQRVEEQLVNWVENPYVLRQAARPVAVLTSKSSASAAEATLIAFRGRADTRTFGQPTAGLPNSPTGKMLSDGAAIFVTGALEMDRTGHVYGYGERIAPDEVVATNPRLIGTDSDPVLLAGMQWLNSMLEPSR